MQFSLLRRGLKQLILWVCWTLLFAAAYSQSPLYTSNQDQYFLHGLAHAGLGHLSSDWLANTQDPTPVFSLMVEWVYRLLHFPPVFYLIYALLMGIYLFSILGTVSKLFGLDKSTLKTLVFLALFIGLQSAVWRFGLARVLGDNWSYVVEDGVADQRLLGPVLQPSTFGVLLVLSIYLFLRNRAYLAVLAAVLAAIVHPTYILSAAALTGAYLLILWREQHRLAPLVGLSLAALLAVSPVLVFILSLFGGSAPQITQEARRILIDFRIPHHALISQWFDATAVFKVGMILLAIYLARRTRLFWIMLVSFLVAFGLTLVQVLTQNAALALLFPWRLSVLLVPLSLAVILARGVHRLVNARRFQNLGAQRWMRVLSAALILVSVLVGVIRFQLDLERKASDPERKIEAYAAANLPDGGTVLTPLKMQDFRLFSGMPVFVDFKSIPYKDLDVLEWYRRDRLADRYYKTRDCSLLSEIVQSEHISYVVLETEQQPACTFLIELYGDLDYGLFQVPVEMRAESAGQP